MKMFFLLLCSLPIFVNCQPTDEDSKFCELKEWNLKGKVKKITNYIFENINPGYAQSKLADTAKCDRRNIATYDRKGNLISLENITKSKTGKVTMKGESKMIYFQNKRVSTQILNGDTFSVAVRQWISDSSYTDTIKNNVNQNTGLNITVLDKNRVIKWQQIESLKEYDIARPVKIYFKFNDRKQLIEIVSQTENGKQTVETNKDFAFDKTGNPIKSMKQQSTKSTLIIRKYEYY